MPDDYYVSQYSGEEIDALLGSAGAGTVRYDAAQSLTDAQKTQARTNIAAASSEFGWGNTSGGTIPNHDFNQAVANGVYFVPFTTDLPANGPPGVPTDGAALLVLAGRIDCIKHQYLFLGTSGLQGQILHRYYHNILEVWSEWEYINPPMQLGVEYRTTERYLGKPVYVKVVDCGAMPSATTKTVNHGISDIQHIVEVKGSLYKTDGSEARSLPYWFSTEDYAEIRADKTSIYMITVGGNWEARNCYAVLKYTKTTN